MKDALDNIRKLPPVCAAVVEGQAVFIRRGAREVSPAFMPTDQVEQWNRTNSVTTAHLRAMEVGLALGWDADGADPDFHCNTALDPNPERLFTIFVPLGLTLKVRTRSDAEGAEAARHLAKQIADDATWTFEDQPWFVSLAQSDGADIIQEEDP